jgi:hypothetical protein
MEATDPIMPVKKYTNAGRQKLLFGKNEKFVVSVTAIIKNTQIFY